jgi:NADPH:quinone reductase-like Zn-dependent oxidoreductase
VLAITYNEFGGPDVLHLSEVAEPHPGPGQVRLRVVAVGVNPSDYKIREGWLQDIFPVQFPNIPGGELAGVVDKVGDGVSDLAVGDEVLGWSDSGAYAQYALATYVAPKPAGLDWATSAAVPVAGGPPPGCSISSASLREKHCCCTPPLARWAPSPSSWPCDGEPR